MSASSTPADRSADDAARQARAWQALRRHTPARIGLGTTGSAIPTRHLLEFQLDHAEARDAVHLPLDVDRLAGGLTGLLGGAPVLSVRSAAEDRASYLQRPDLGRRLHPRAAATLPHGEYDIAFVVADGLSARAVHDHAPGLLREVAAALPDWRAAPVVVATGARVALGDEVARALGARMVAVLIGERPGLSSADSLGVYLTYDPSVPRTDAERNCLSNIRPPHGTDYPTAAATLVRLMTQARLRRLTGVALKDDSPALPAPPDRPLSR
ncbi:ethanolamine ammonia-lyase subunit EutC [Streptomyces sp.]|uniref:ethanolamine ammonia-lyase subunit EutC n=1 Tax=Streptomyces sp. TaxID=1931 RepID=UPI002F40C153